MNEIKNASRKQDREERRGEGKRQVSGEIKRIKKKEDAVQSRDGEEGDGGGASMLHPSTHHPPPTCTHPKKACMQESEKQTEKEERGIEAVRGTSREAVGGSSEKGSGMQCERVRAGNVGSGR